MATTITPGDVAHIASLANIPVTDEEKKTLACGFNTTITIVEKLNTLDVSKVDAKHMTGLLNVLREDEVDEKRMFTQDQALANGDNTYNGYFVVDRIIEAEE